MIAAKNVLKIARPSEERQKLRQDHGCRSPDFVTGHEKGGDREPPAVAFAVG
jgi:hypothetical protein